MQGLTYFNGWTMLTDSFNAGYGRTWGYGLAAGGNGAHWKPPGWRTEPCPYQAYGVVCPNGNRCPNLHFAPQDAENRQRLRPLILQLAKAFKKSYEDYIAYHAHFQHQAQQYRGEQWNHQSDARHYKGTDPVAPDGWYSDRNWQRNYPVFPGNGGTNTAWILPPPFAPRFCS
ncbi:uncharacterized protein LOC129602621 [Paramacrobiotus metropolitanus]|uniref:uncharacterized protein LOC129602621 n=1 Tax=Paramacrobiotus metropolitanus TaxID=2943436 RepID=UPI0024456FEA|nr:uncharacterized protein LOC129602621 [Paramacrobiotus metropolitanus]